MGNEQSKAFIHRIYDAFNSRDYDSLDELFDPAFEDYSVGVPFQTPFDLDGLKGLIKMYVAAFPDAKWTIGEIVTEGFDNGDRAAWKDHFTGTHQGELMGIAPTGRKVSVSGMSMGEIRNGKAFRHTGIFDNLGLMQQLGVIPPMG